MGLRAIGGIVLATGLTTAGLASSAVAAEPVSGDPGGEEVAAERLAVEDSAISAQQAEAEPETLVVDRDRVQCPDADHISIQAAVLDTRAVPGTTIQVCPDTYNEDVTIPPTKPELTLKARSRREPTCLDPTDQPTPEDDAIVTGGGFNFNVTANGTTLEGFAIQGATFGAVVGPLATGTQLTNNLVQSNLEGVTYRNAAAQEGRIDHNCIRLNNGHGTFAQATHNALIDHNQFFRNGRANVQSEGLHLSGPAVSNVTVRQNDSLDDRLSLGVSRTDQVTVEHNRSREADSTAIRIEGANDELVVDHNDLADAVDGILFSRLVVGVGLFGPNTNARIDFNSIESMTRFGIHAEAGSLTNSLIARNESGENGQDGINLLAGNTGNRVERNESDANGSDGIHAQGATGNMFERNRMLGNAEHDAHDDNRPSNTWTRNHCVTDQPPGTICGVK